MTASDAPLTAADFVWDEFSWRIEVQIPEWVGYRKPMRQINPESEVGREAPQPADVVDLFFAPEGRDDAPLNDREVQAVQWAVEHRSALSRIVLATVYAEYPTIRTDLLEVYDLEEVGDLAPPIEDPDGLKGLIGLSAIFVHRLDTGEAPYVGFLLECTWEEEHGLGVLMQGTRVVEIGDGDVAHTEWIAERDRDRRRSEGSGEGATAD